MEILDWVDSGEYNSIPLILIGIALCIIAYEDFRYRYFRSLWLLPLIFGICFHFKGFGGLLSFSITLCIVFLYLNFSTRMVRSITSCIGEGDIILLALLSLTMDYYEFSLWLFLGSILGLIYYLVAWLLVNQQRTIPFATTLAIAYFVLIAHVGM